MIKKVIIILVVIVLAVGAGFLFKDNLVKVYDGLIYGIKNFQNTNFGSLISKATKEVFTPPPLNFGGSDKRVILTASVIIEETNSQRQDNGDLPELIKNELLTEAALAKAKDMFENQYFEHESLSGVTPGQLVQNAGYEFIVAGENLILGNFSSEKELVQAWMDSPGHRANILNNKYTEIGVAIIKGKYEGSSVWIGVQEFGLPLSTCPNPNEALKMQIEEMQAGLEGMSVQIEQIKDEIKNTDRRAENYNNLVSLYNQLVVNYNSTAENLKSQISQYNIEVNNFNNCFSAN